jgi:hypothetical protein
MAAVAHSLRSMGLTMSLCCMAIACTGPHSERAVDYASESCALAPACDAAPPELIDSDGFRHTRSTLMSKLVSEHRGRDVYLVPGARQVVMAKFAYGESSTGVIDKDLEDEDIDVYLLRGCRDGWEHLGTGRTYGDDNEPGDFSNYAFDDWGGRLMFDIPDEHALGLGRHRLHLVVRGDGTSTNAFIEVVPTGTTVFASDIDGTLTTGEFEDVLKRPFGPQPNIRPHAVDALRFLANKGYRPFYLTARPERVTQRTRELLDDAGFPAGVIRTSQSGLGAFGSASVKLKTGALAALRDAGLQPTIAIGNTETDATAFAAADVFERYFHQYDDVEFGGIRFETYDELSDKLSDLPSVCAGPE